MLDDADDRVALDDFIEDREGDELRIDFGDGNTLTVVTDELRLGTEVVVSIFPQPGSDAVGGSSLASLLGDEGAAAAVV